MAGLREFLDSSAGKGAAIVLVLVGVAAVFISTRGGTGSAVAEANERVFIDSKTGKPYNVDLKTGMKIPAPAPSGTETGYPAELCYWTKDGKPKSDPTPVLLNSWTGKSGPTFCPECGRLVVGHNPRAGEGMKVPPTEAEYKATHKGGQDEDR